MDTIIDTKETPLPTYELEALIKSIICDKVKAQPLAMTVPGANLEWIHEVVKSISSLQSLTVSILCHSKQSDAKIVALLKKIYAELIEAEEDEMLTSRYIRPSLPHEPVYSDIKLQKNKKHKK